MGQPIDSLKVRLKMIEGVGRLYWGKHGYIRKVDITSKTDWKSALELFIEHYAFARLRGFPVYSKGAVKALRAVAGKSKKPSPTITRDVWEEFKKRGYSLDSSDTKM